jgi:hypothetical protein
LVFRLPQNRFNIDTLPAGASRKKLVLEGLTAIYCQFFSDQFFPDKSNSYQSQFFPEQFFPDQFFLGQFFTGQFFPELSQLEHMAALKHDKFVVQCLSFLLNHISEEMDI